MLRFPSVLHGDGIRRLKVFAFGVAFLIFIICVRKFLTGPPLAVLFLGLLGFWLYETVCSFRVAFTPELRAKFESWLQRVKDWRRDSPRMFCLVSSGCLGSLAILGHLISGSTLVLTILVISALVSTKCNFKLVQFEQRDYQWSEKINYNNVEADLDDEFMPDENETNLFVLERASDVATISSPTDADHEGAGIDDDDDDRSDDIPSELLIPDAIPEIDEHSTDEDDELVPLSRTSKSTKTQASTAGDEQLLHRHTAEESRTEKENGNAIDFRRCHFKPDSSLSNTSSSSEESLSKGLQFPDHTSVDAGGTTTTTALRQLTAGPNSADIASATASASSLMALAVKTQAQALLPNLMSNLVQWKTSDGIDSTDSTTAPAKNLNLNLNQNPNQRRQVTALDSSDESDFEILESDDFQ